jgi:hypothetical protein
LDEMILVASIFCGNHNILRGFCVGEETATVKKELRGDNMGIERMQKGHFQVAFLHWYL